MKTDIKIVLSNGDHLTIDLANEELFWEVVETDEREMGVERLHEAVIEKSVGDNNVTVLITLRVWEYPEGFFNMQEIEVEGGELEEECDLGQFAISYYEDEI